MIHSPEALLSCGGKRGAIETLRGEPVAAFCGIGNPAAFRHTLQQCGYRAVAFREFPDHHGYDRADVESLIGWAEGLEVRAVICTHKDLVKISLD